MRLRYSISTGGPASLKQGLSRWLTLPDRYCFRSSHRRGCPVRSMRRGGGMRFSEPSLKVEYADGTRAIECVFEEHGVERSRASQILWLRFRDRGYPLTVTLYYRIYDGHDVIERWVRLENSGGGGPVTIEQALSADWRPPRRERYRLTYLYGQHMKEMQVADIELRPGKFVLE